MEGMNPLNFPLPRQLSGGGPLQMSVLRFPETKDLRRWRRVSGNAHKGRNGTITRKNQTPMSIIHTAYTAVCNACGKTLQDPDGNTRTFATNIAAIQAARTEGWAVNVQGNNDYCTDCKTKYNQ